MTQYGQPQQPLVGEFMALAIKTAGGVAFVARRLDVSHAQQRFINRQLEERIAPR